MINEEIPLKDQCIIISNVVNGKYGIYFDCPSKFSPNTQTFILNYRDENRKMFPIRITVKESVKTTCMKLNNERPPFSLSYLIYKRYNEKKHELANRLKRTDSFDDLEALYN
jgi:hypothetical protein